MKLKVILLGIFQAAMATDFIIKDYEMANHELKNDIVNLSGGLKPVPCQNEFNSCQFNNRCSADLLSWQACIILSGKKYGCLNAMQSNTTYPAYNLQCLYNCFEQMNAVTVQFSNLRDCVNKNLPIYDQICYNQTVGCLTDFNGTCVDNLNVPMVCALNPASSVSCAIYLGAQQQNETNLYPAYLMACNAQCLFEYSNTNPNNSSTIFNNFQNCMGNFGGVDCGNQLNSCLLQQSGVCVGYLNQAMVCGENNANCVLIFTQYESQYVQGCNKQCFKKVHVNQQNTEWSNLVTCLADWKSAYGLIAIEFIFILVLILLV